MRHYRVAITALVIGACLTSLSPLEAQIWEGPAAVAIRVTDDDGQPIEQAQVVARTSDAESAGPPAVETDAAGRAVLSGLREGEWFIEVSHDGYMLYAAYVNLRAGKKPVVGFSSQVNTATSWEPMRVKFQKSSAEFGRVASTRRAEPKAPKVVREEAPPPASEPRVTRRQPEPPKVVRPEPDPASPPPSPVEEEPVTAEAPTPEAPVATTPAEASVAEPAVAASDSEAESQQAEKLPSETQPTPAAADATPESDDIEAPTAVAAATAPVPSEEVVAQKTAEVTEAVEAGTAPIATTEPPAEEPKPEVMESASEERVETPQPVEVTEPEPSPAEAVAESERSEAAAQPSAAAAPEITGAPAPALPESTVEPVEPDETSVDPTPSLPEATPPASETAPIEAPMAETVSPPTPESVVEPADSADLPVAAPDTDDSIATAPADPIEATTAAPSPAPEPPAGPAVTGPLPRFLRSAAAGTCSECEAGEWAVAAEQEAARASDLVSRSECNEEYLASAQSGAQRLADAPGSRLDGYTGPILTSMFRLDQGAEREQIQELLGSVASPESNCQMAGIVLPNDTSYSGYVFEAWDSLGGRSCRAKLDCAVGRARWLDEPQVVVGAERTVVYSIFKNRSTRRPRRLRMTVYFKPLTEDWVPRTR